MIIKIALRKWQNLRRLLEEMSRFKNTYFFSSQASRLSWLGIQKDDKVYLIVVEGFEKTQLNLPLYVRKHFWA